MICEPCRTRDHGECPGGTWCDCQHQPPRLLAEPDVRDPGAATVRELPAGVVIGEEA